MATLISIDHPANARCSLRIAIEHENNPDVEITILKPGEYWRGYVSKASRIVAIEEAYGHTHLGRLAAPVSTG